MVKYMVLKVFSHPYENIQPCEYDGKTVFGSIGEAKDALSQSLLDFVNELGLGVKDLANMIAREEIRMALNWYSTNTSEVGRLYIDAERQVEWRIMRIEI